MPVPTGDSTPAYVPVTVDDLATYLSNPDLDESRATTILGYATTLCLSIVSPLPVGAEVVVLDVAERAYSNPTSTSSDSNLGLYSEGVGPFSTSTPGISGGGLWLTENNKATLRRLAGSGGAFSIDTLPASYTPSLPWWDTSAAAGLGAGWYG